MSKKLSLILTLIGLSGVHVGYAQELKYPEAKKGEVIDQYSYDYLAQIPYRDQLKQQLTDIWNYEKIGRPFVEWVYAANTTTGNELYIQDLSKPGSKIENILSGFGHSTHVFDNDGDIDYIRQI